MECLSEGREAPFPENRGELAESLALLDEAQAYLRAIFLGLALQYRSFDLRRALLLCQESQPEINPTAVQTAASLITLCALFGFQNQTERLACQEAQAGGVPDLTDVKLGAAVILIALIRLVRLQRPAPDGSRRAAVTVPQQEAELEEELSDAADAV